jgi:tetratricopeptide (TPR) repeat protein/predicted Ser/Thr protein kinase
MLGSGGLGIVFEAWDPKLQRHVAVKLVRTRRERRGSQRFLREAQALARLSHPNVVAVYGVGTCDDERTVYVVMEHIDGKTLRVWADEEPRDVAALLEVFLAAGRGLAAAHEAGMVHRDFKPDNVMIDGEGRVRVLDFGLALIGAPGTESLVGEGAESVEPRVSSGSDVRLTEAGVVMGTPTYMAPEQHRGLPVSPASDQFSFCVALLRLLRGGAPVFAGGDARAMAVQKAKGRIAPGPEGDTTPRWLEQVLRRGLQPDPQRRWPSMAALLQALERTPASRGRWAAWGIVGALGLGALAFLPTGDDCTQGAGRLSDAWSGTARDRARETLEAALGERAEDAFAYLDEQMGADATAWAEAHVDACQAHRDGRLDDAGFDRRIACLRVRATERERLIASVGERVAQAAGVREALVGLGELAGCADDQRLAATALEAPLPGDVGRATGVEAVREQLGRIDGLARDGAFDEAAQILEAQQPRVEALAYDPLRAELLRAQGKLDASRGDARVAVERFEEGLAVAEASGHDYLAAALASDLVFEWASSLRQLEDAQRMLARAKALLERAGEPRKLLLKLASAEVSLLLRAQRYDEAMAVLDAVLPDAVPTSPGGKHRHSILLNNLALVHLRSGRAPQAQQVLLEALALREEALGADHPKLGTLHLNVAKAMLRNGAYDEAERHLTTSVELATAYGADHVDVARPLVSRGVVRKKQGRFDAAREDYTRALSLIRNAERGDMEAMVLANLGNLEKRAGNLPAAVEHHAAALALRESLLGPDALEVADSVGDIGSLYRKMKRFDDARAQYDRELSIRSRAVGAQHPSMARVRLHRANLALDEGAFVRAREELDEGLRVIAAATLNDNAAAMTYVSLGKLEASENDHDAAIRALREGIRRIEAMSKNPAALGGARLMLAQSLWAMGKHGEARNALSAARVELRRAGPAVAAEREELEATARAWSGPTP